MSAPSQSETPQRQGEPALLWDRVLEARSVVASKRRSPIDSSALIARAELLSALEAYAASLTHHRRPIPYLLRDELRLKRLTR